MQRSPLFFPAPFRVERGKVVQDLLKAGSPLEGQVTSYPSRFLCSRFECVPERSARAGR